MQVKDHRILYFHVVAAGGVGGWGLESICERVTEWRLNDHIIK